MTSFCCPVAYTIAHPDMDVPAHRHDSLGCWLDEPLVAMALYFAFAVFLVVPFRDVGRRLFRRS